MANPYVEFLKLLPGDKQVIGQATSVDGVAKTTIIGLLGGGFLKVRGEGVVGNYYLVEGGIIQQELPVLSIYNVEIA